MKQIIFSFLLIAFTKVYGQSNDSLCVKNIDLKYDSIEKMHKMYVTISYTGAGNNCMCMYPSVDYILDDKGDTIAQGFSRWYFGHIKNTEQAYPIATKLTSLPANLKCTVYFNGGTFTDLILLSYPCVTSGIEEIKPIEAKVFPNPFVSSTTISMETDLNNASLKLFDVLGNELQQSQNLLGRTATINRNDLPAGVYFYQVIENNKILAKGKLLAE